MAPGAESCGENLADRRVTVWFPREESFFDEVVSSHDQLGKSLVVSANAVQETLNQKKHHRKSVKDVSPDQGTMTRGPVHASSHMVPETGSAKDCGEELVGCRVKLWRPEIKAYVEGVITKYYHSHKKALVVYANGAEAMLNLRKVREPAVDVSPDQAHKAHSQSHDSTSKYDDDGDDDDSMDAKRHVQKKHKAQSFDPSTPSASSAVSKKHKAQKLEFDAAPTDSTTSSIPGDDTPVNVNGYNVNATTAPILESIFAKYGDIAADCLYKSTSVKASLLEVICKVVQRLQYNNIEAVLSDLEVIENEVSDIEASKIDVTWLREHLAKVRDIAAFKENSIRHKKAKETARFITKAAEMEVRQRKAELLLAQERLKDAEKRVIAMGLVSKKIDEDIMECESEEYFWRRRLDDLL